MHNLNTIAGGNYIIQISAKELREVVGIMYEEERQRIEKAVKEHKEQATLTRKQAAKLLGVTTSTLWKWDTIGYLKPVKLGSRVFYRPTDIDALLTKHIEVR